MLLNRTSNAAKNRNNFSKMMISMGQRYPTLRGARLHHQEASLDHHLAISASRSSSSTAVAAPHLVHSTRLRTLATTVFIRGIATRSGKGTLSSDQWKWLKPCWRHHLTPFGVAEQIRWHR
jgi:hypothetical protein